MDGGMQDGGVPAPRGQAGRQAAGARASRLTCIRNTVVALYVDGVEFGMVRSGFGLLYSGSTVYESVRTYCTPTQGATSNERARAHWPLALPPRIESYAFRAAPS